MHHVCNSIKDIAIYSPLPATTQSTSSEWHPTSTLIITVSSSGTIRIWELEALLGLGMNATPESAVEQALIGEYNTGSRLTCVAACYGFAMA
jgi:WD40 repeat protein